MGGVPLASIPIKSAEKAKEYAIKSVEKSKEYATKSV